MLRGTERTERETALVGSSIAPKSEKRGMSLGCFLLQLQLPQPGDDLRSFLEHYGRFFRWDDLLAWFSRHHNPDVLFRSKDHGEEFFAHHVLPIPLRAEHSESFMKILFLSPRELPLEPAAIKRVGRLKLPV